MLKRKWHYDIVKLQRPLFSSRAEHADDIMVYNEDHTIFDTQKMTQEKIDAVFHGEYKVYWKVRVRLDKLAPMELLKEVGGQVW